MASMYQNYEMEDAMVSQSKPYVCASVRAYVRPPVRTSVRQFVLSSVRQFIRAPASAFAGVGSPMMPMRLFILFVMFVRSFLSRARPPARAVIPPFVRPIRPFMRPSDHAKLPDIIYDPSRNTKDTKGQRMSDDCIYFMVSISQPNRYVSAHSAKYVNSCTICKLVRSAIRAASRAGGRRRIICIICLLSII